MAQKFGDLAAGQELSPFLRLNCPIASSWFQALDLQKADRHLLLMVKPHDIVLMLGAGDITRVADDFVRRLQGQSSLIEQVKL